jgi:hypothetical protein
MANEMQLEVYRALRSAQDKYTYFLLAAAGAAIALTVNQTHEAKLAWSQLPLAAAVLSWALSFVFGCLHLQYDNSILYANADLLKIKSGQHPSVGTHPQMITAASDGIREAIEENSKRSVKHASRQFAFLIVGAVLFLAWHVTEMYARTATVAGH